MSETDEVNERELRRMIAVANERRRLEENAEAYMTFGDVDKPFHRPECECDSCELWRISVGRPTHQELRDKRAATSRESDPDEDTPLERVDPVPGGTGGETGTGPHQDGGLRDQPGG